MKNGSNSNPKDSDSVANEQAEEEIGETLSIGPEINFNIPIQWVISDHLSTRLLRKRPHHQLPIRDYLEQMKMLGIEIRDKYKHQDLDPENYPHEVLTAQQTITWSSEALDGIRKNDAESTATAMRNLLEEYIRAFEHQQKGAQKNKLLYQDIEIARRIAKTSWDQEIEDGAAPSSYKEMLEYIKPALSTDYTDETIKNWWKGKNKKYRGNIVPSEVAKGGRPKK